MEVRRPRWPVTFPALLTGILLALSLLAGNEFLVPAVVSLGLQCMFAGRNLAHERVELLALSDWPSSPAVCTGVARVLHGYCVRYRVQPLAGTPFETTTRERPERPPRVGEAVELAWDPEDPSRAHPLARHSCH